LGVIVLVLLVLVFVLPFNGSDVGLVEGAGGCAAVERGIGVDVAGGGGGGWLAAASRARALCRRNDL
jgi:hypothetical protein